VLVFSRDVSILGVGTVLYAIAGLRDFRPSLFGKANTFCQVAAVFFVMLFEVDKARWIYACRWAFLRAVFAFTIISGVHYIYLVGVRLKTHNLVPPTPQASR
jgi:cardiolipin synthase